VSSPRLRAAVAATGVVALGLVATRLGLDALGDALYAVLVGLLVVLVAPRTRGLVVGALAFAWCALVELAQLTGLPGHAMDAVPLLRYVLGTTFVATDLLAYAAGAACVAVGVGRARARSADDERRDEQQRVGVEVDHLRARGR